MNGFKISGVGSYLPKRSMTNEDLLELVDTSDEWITKRVGIKERHLVGDDESLLTMSHQASVLALQDAGVEVDEVDLIIVGTVSADNIFPSAACMLQQSLGIKNHCPAFDVNAACAGFIYALNIAEKFFQSGAIKTALIVGADAISKIVDWTDRSTCVLFGDGAGAVVLQTSDEARVLATDFGCNGSHHDLLYAHNSIWQDDEKQYVKMQGKEVFRYATTKLKEMVEHMLESTGLTKSDIDWLIPHQANKRIIEAIVRQLEFDENNIIQTIEYHGNTSSGSVPLALDAAIKDGRIKRGDLLLLEAFGGGFAWGAVLIRF